MANNYRAGSHWDRVFLGSNRYGESKATPVQPAVGQDNTQRVGRQADRTFPTRPDQDFIYAFAGDDRGLLPYQPTPTINPGRPRTLAAGYDQNSMTLRVKFRDGDVYGYYNVPPSVWYRFQRASSPGRFINTVLQRYPYSKEVSQPYMRNRPTDQGIQ